MTSHVSQVNCGPWAWRATSSTVTSIPRLLSTPLLGEPRRYF